MTDGQKPAGRRARHTRASRPHRVNLCLSDSELAALKQAAEKHGFSPGAYAARSAVAVAEGEIVPIAVDQRRLLQQLADSRAQVRRIGNNLNQIAHVLNSDGEVTPAQLEAVLSRVGEAVARLDSATVDLMSGR